MNWFLLGKFPLQQDLSGLHQLLNSHRIAHRFTEESGEQFLWIADANNVNELKNMVQGLESQSPISTSRSANDPQALNENEDSYKAKRISAALQPSKLILTIAVIVFGALGFGANEILGREIFSSVFAYMKPAQILKQGEVWRFITPAFLHFGFFHFLFNSIWIWELGRRLEYVVSRWVYVALFLSSAFGANLLEYQMDKTIHFGGLSGVVYGYLGFLLIYNKKLPQELVVPRSYFIFMLIWLMVGFSGLLFVFFGIRVGNWSHLGGLLFGLGVGALYYLAPSKSVND